MNSESDSLSKVAGAFETVCGLQLQEVKSFKRISFKPQLACFFNSSLFCFGLYITRGR